MKHGIRVGNLSRFAYLIMTVFCMLCGRDMVLAQSAMKSSSGGHIEADSPKVSKPHYILYAENPEQQPHIEKCIAKYAYWHKHRMKSKRRTIEIVAPYTAKIELFSELELHQLSGTRIHAGASDNETDYQNLWLVVTPNGFKELTKNTK